MRIHFAPVRMTLILLALSVPAGRLRAEEKPKPLRVLLFSGMNNHDWKRTTPLLVKVLNESGRFAVDVTDDPARCGPDTFGKYDVIVSNWTNWPDVKGRLWPAATEKAFLDFVRGGKGFALFHAACTPFQTWPEFQQIVGTTWKLGATGHGRIHRFKVVVADKSHPITRGVPDFMIMDELWHRAGKQPNIHVLCTAFSTKANGGSGQDEPIALCTTFGKGRGFNLILGHDVRAMQSPGWQSLMLRGVEWAATGQVTIPPRQAANPTDELTEEDLDDDVQAIAGYAFGQDRTALQRVERWTYHVATKPALRKRLTARLAALLKADATPDAKRFACGQLSLIGSAAEVPVLAGLLTDKELSLAARSALEQIPGAEALTALRSAMATAKGPLLIGLINTLGNRRDAASAPTIARHLTDANADVAAAAIHALGKIGGSQATASLRAVAANVPAKLRPPLDNALLRCADCLAASGRAADARSIYADMMKADKPTHVRIAGFVGFVACEKDRQDDVLLSALAGQDEALRTAAIGVLRSTTGDSDGRRMARLIAEAIARSKDQEAKKTLLECLGATGTIETLRLARSHLADPALADVACRVILQAAPRVTGANRAEAKSVLNEVLSKAKSAELQAEALVVLLKLTELKNLAIGATASSPDELDKDHGAHGDQAGIDGDPATYWDEQDDQKLYRYRVTFESPVDVSAISILGHRHHDYSPRDFDVLCDGKVVKAVKNATYAGRELIVVFPRTRCTSLELKITAYYGRSPAIRELGVYDFRPVQ